MAGPTVAFFAMFEDGHVRRMLPLVAGLSARGARVVMYADARFGPVVRAAGGEMRDLFEGRSLDDADPESLPRGSRYVAFAGHYGDAVTREVRRLAPSLVVQDPFAVVARVVARELRVPDACVLLGHGVHPGHIPELRAQFPVVRASARCLEAIEILRTRHGFEDASPFLHVGPPSRWLNVHGEPAGWLDGEERRAFEPVAFFGSLPSDVAERSARPVASPFPGRAGTRLRVYASFGTIVWRYFADRALADLEAVAEAVGRRRDAVGLIGLGGAPLDAAARARLARENVRVEDRADQDAALRHADVFVSHHGLNSTHEAVWHGVPMASRPVFWDQPALAARCRELGLAVPAGAGGGAPLTADGVDAALAAVEERRDAMRPRFAQARAWEAEVIADRPRVIDRLLSLASAARPA